jgi:3-hydroxyisobutyrate dehydrogenase
MDEGRIGFIGLGRMGWPMARHLVAGGHALVVLDAAPDRAAAFAREGGAEVASGPGALARRCTTVITMLPDGAAVREVVLGGLAEAVGASAVVVDMGSSDPAVYPELAAALAARGAELVDAPVSGGVAGAEAATLTIMAGGAPAALERIEPLLRLMGARIFRTGALGSGQAMKALNNLCSAGALILTVEALLIGQRFGLDPALMTEILNVSTGRSNATDKKIAPHVLSRRFDSGFALALMAKDLTTALAIAESSATPTTLAPPTLQIVRDALAALGPGADHTEVARLLERRAGAVLGGAGDKSD